MDFRFYNQHHIFTNSPRIFLFWVSYVSECHQIMYLNMTSPVEEKGRAHNMGFKGFKGWSFAFCFVSQCLRLNLQTETLTQLPARTTASLMTDWMQWKRWSVCLFFSVFISHSDECDLFWLNTFKDKGSVHAEFFLIKVHSICKWDVQNRLKILQKVPLCLFFIISDSF